MSLKSLALPLVALFALGVTPALAGDVCPMGGCAKKEASVAKADKNCDTKDCPKEKCDKPKCDAKNADATSAAAPTVAATAAGQEAKPQVASSTVAK